MRHKNTKFIAIRCVLSSSKCSKTVFGQGCTRTPLGGAYDALPDPLVSWGGDTPPHTLHSSTLSVSRSRITSMFLAPP